MNTCPCCSEQLLRHTRNGNVYWFCHHCWQEMPTLPESVGEQSTLQLEQLISALPVAAGRK